MADTDFEALQGEWNKTIHRVSPGQTADCSVIGERTHGLPGKSWGAKGPNNCNYWFRRKSDGAVVACRNGGTPCRDSAPFSGSVPWNKPATTEWMREAMTPAAQSGGRRTRRRRRRRRSKTRRSSRGVRRRRRRNQVHRSRRRK